MNSRYYNRINEINFEYIWSISFNVRRPLRLVLTWVQNVQKVQTVDGSNSSNSSNSWKGSNGSKRSMMRVYSLGRQLAPFEPFEPFRGWEFRTNIKKSLESKKINSLKYLIRQVWLRIVRTVLGQESFCMLQLELFSDWFSQFLFVRRCHFLK